MKNCSETQDVIKGSADLAELARSSYLFSSIYLAMLIYIHATCHNYALTLMKFHINLGLGSLLPEKIAGYLGGLKWAFWQKRI